MIFLIWNVYLNIISILIQKYKKKCIISTYIKKMDRKTKWIFEKKIIENIELIYRGSRDGFQSRQFHNRCDNKGEIL